MKLLLSSAGLENLEVKKVFQEKIKLLKNKRIGVFCYEMKSGFAEWLESLTAILKDVDSEIEIVFLNLSEDIDQKSLPDCGAYYVSGGNTFFILSRIKKLGLDKFLSREIDNDKFYFGVSAGSMILGQDIKRFSELLNDKNEAALEDCSGFKKVPFDIVPHYKESMEDGILAIYENDENPVVAISDNQAVLVTDEEMEIIGPEDECFLLD